MHTTILSKFSNLTFNYKFDCMNIIYNDIFNGSRTAMDNIAHIIFLEVFDSIHAAILYYELHKLEIEN